MCVIPHYRIDDVEIVCRQKLDTLFVDKRISQWRYHLPDARTTAERVRNVISYLYTQYDQSRKNALSLFLQVVYEHLPFDDSLQQQMQNLIERIENELRN